MKEEVISKHKCCGVCGSWIKLTKTPNNIHFGRLDCPKCGFVGWAKNPDNPRNKGTKLLRHGNRLTVEKIMTFHGYKEPFCFLCLRKIGDLGVRETLTADHIQELRSSKNKDLDRVENGQILCSACHKIKLWMTTYLNEHIKGKKENGNTDTA